MIQNGQTYPGCHQALESPSIKCRLAHRGRQFLVGATDSQTFAHSRRGVQRSTVGVKLTLVSVIALFFVLTGHLSGYPPSPGQYMAQGAVGCQYRGAFHVPSSHSYKQTSPQLSQKPARVTGCLLRTARGRQLCSYKVVQHSHIGSCHRQTARRAVHLCPCVGCLAQNCSDGADVPKHDHNSASIPNQPGQVCSIVQHFLPAHQLDQSNKQVSQLCRSGGHS